MLAEIEALLVIQNRDQKLRSIQQELSNIPLEEEDLRERVADDQAKVDAIKSELAENEVAMKNIELDIDTRKDSVTKLKVQQYETKKNDEFRAMGNEIERYGKEIVSLEDDELELMEKAEKIKERLKVAESARDESTADLDEELQHLTTAKENLSKQKVELEANRAGYAEKVDEILLDTYERLFHSKNGHAIVGLIDGKCEGCHISVVKSTVVSVRQEREITHCDNCGRILYWWTDETDRVIDRYE